jgi:O-antigen/teichoic acid export membrane protein
MIGVKIRGADTIFSKRIRGAAFLRTLGGGVAVQVLTSATNFIVGLLLIRRTSSLEYGSFVLINTAVVFATTLQGAFIQPPMVIRLTSADRNGRATLIGGLYRDQTRLVPLLIVFPLAAAVVLAVRGQLDARAALILVAGTLAVICALHREFLRMVLFAYRLPNFVLQGDCISCVLLIAGAAVATFTPFPAAAVAAGMSMAALAERWQLSKVLWRLEPWDRNAPRGALREIFHQGSWSAFGGGMHFLFGQGYTYLVAAILNVPAVAALAATRLPIVPVNLISNGISALMLPTVSRWNQDHRAGVVLRRLAVFAAGLVGLMCAYLALMWLARDWIFTYILKKSFEQRDMLLLLWAVLCLVSVFRDQFMYFLAARARFQLMSSVTFICAVIALTTTFLAVRRLGTIGAPIGVLTGESINIAFTLALAAREARSRPGRAQTASSLEPT